MANTVPETIEEPFPIFKVAHHYLIYDVNVVSHIRREYNICGVLSGTLPQSPQQNVFQGLPLQLMPEEARVLIDKGVAYLEDDHAAHKRTFLGNGMSTEEKRAYQAALRRQGAAAAKEAGRKKAADKMAALSRNSDTNKTENWNDIPEDMLKPASGRRKNGKGKKGDQTPSDRPSDTEEALFDSSTPDTTTNGHDYVPADITTDPDPLLVTPTVSVPPLHSTPPPRNTSTPQRSPVPTPASYPLFAHLHSKGYYLSPGLRFGCQYVAYPGDPLRFHSHFLCNGMEWDEEFDLLDVVSAGRLGTGVKKGFLLGGETDSAKAEDRKDHVRTFCVEWAGM